MAIQNDREQQITKEEMAVFREVLKAMRQIKHGYIHLVVQDSRVIQIDKTEKVRLASSGGDSSYHI